MERGKISLPRKNKKMLSPLLDLMCDIMKSNNPSKVILFSHQQRKGVKFMDTASLFLSSIPAALDSLKRIVAYIWAEDRAYIMAFLAFVLTYSSFSSLLKKKYPF